MSLNYHYSILDIFSSVENLFYFFFGFTAGFSVIFFPSSLLESDYFSVFGSALSVGGRFISSSSMDY